ncbi:sulfotransferase 1A1-like [Patiria miniata]|uniref:Sulfotransferase domain-containing protein n=1 Tax=Patiria miniata TaxID=46514 RepID=A0A914A3Y0_PATMI|nr:sulfotransferase 1A1-like [Patiria miniata]
MAEHYQNGIVDAPPQRQGTRQMEGLNWPTMVTQECLDALKTYDVWEDDVWVTTYPKSGSHWVMEIVNLILADGNEQTIDRSQQSVPAEFDFTEANLGSGPGPRPKPVPQYKEMLTWKAPRVIMTHVTEELMPAQIYQGKGKVIFVIRNPKDAIVSKWHFSRAKGFGPRYEDWDTFLQEYLSGAGTYGTWFSYVSGFWKKHRHDKNFLFLMYEDMKKDLKGAVVQIADFLGKPLSEDTLNRVVDFSSVKSMKQRFHVNTAPAAKSGVPNADARAPPPGPSETLVPAARASEKIGAPATMRKGIVGDWKSMFTVAQNEAFDEVFRKEMKGSGLKIQFE